MLQLKLNRLFFCLIKWINISFVWERNGSYFGSKSEGKSQKQSYSVQFEKSLGRTFRRNSMVTKMPSLIN